MDKERERDEEGVEFAKSSSKSANMTSTSPSAVKVLSTSSPSSSHAHALAHAPSHPPSSSSSNRAKTTPEKDQRAAVNTLHIKNEPAPVPTPRLSTATSTPPASSEATKSRREEYKSRERPRSRSLLMSTERESLAESAHTPDLGTKLQRKASGSTAANAPTPALSTAHAASTAHTRDTWSADEAHVHSTSPPQPSLLALRVQDAAQAHAEELVHLNIGGQRFTTTKTTLLSRGENFFTPLLAGKIRSLRDETGAYFIDRNGAYFAPILDYLRYGELLIPATLNRQAVLREAEFYSIDVRPGICGDIKEGLYTSSQWILFLERDPHQPWCWGVTGVEDSARADTKSVFFKLICHVRDGTLQWRHKANTFEVYASGGKVFIRNLDAFDQRYQLFFRCAPSRKFPLEAVEVLQSDKHLENAPYTLSFIVAPKAQVQAKLVHPSEPDALYDVEVLCRRLLIMRVSDDDHDEPRPFGTSQSATGSSTPPMTDIAHAAHWKRSRDWLLYLHSDLAFFSFGHQALDFGSAFNRVAPHY